MKTDTEKLADAEEIIRKYGSEITLLKRRIRDITRENDTAETIREEIYKIAARDPEPPEWLTRVPSSSKMQETPFFFWSDWHGGEVVKRAQTNGMNEFNSTILKQRVRKLVDTSIYLAMEKNSTGKPTYPGAVLAIGGDMITGDIHEELRVTNDRTPQEAIEDLIDLLGSGIEHMATAFGRLFIPAVYGNHARSTLRPRFKNLAQTSHEWNIYCGLVRHFKKSKHIRFLVSDGADVAFKSYGQRYLLTHGDMMGVKGGDGIIGALGPIFRGALKIHRANATIGQDFDTLLCGHWHQNVFMKWIMVNNALIGMNEFSHLALRAPFALPSQSMWYTHPTHGITSMRDITLEDRPVARDDRVWVSWQE